MLRVGRSHRLPVGFACRLRCLFALHTQFQADHLLESNGDYVVFRTMPTSANLAASERQLIYTDLVLDSVIADPDILALLQVESSDEER